MLYHQTEFYLSTQSCNFVKNLYTNIFRKNFEHDADYNTLANIWKISPLVKDLQPFLQKFNIDLYSCTVNTFVSNTSKYTKTNPHVDVSNDGSISPIKTRFNILILGNTYDPMLWWNDYKFGHVIYETKNFIVGKHTYQSLTIPGNSVEDRLNLLGQADLIKHDLLLPSAFVNTFVAHALEISSGPRLVLSVGIDKHINEIITWQN